MILFDATHTAHCDANTGVQRVCRRLYAAVGAVAATVAVADDPYAGRWRPLDAPETALLRFPGNVRPGSKRGARWGLARRWLSRAEALNARFRPITPSAGAAILPEVFGDHRAAGGISKLREHVSGPVLAVFHDLIPLQMPEATSPGTIASFRAYLGELKHADVVAAVSEASAGALREHWDREGLRDRPDIVVIPLATDIPVAAPAPAVRELPRVLCVGSLEGRKNHVALLEAAERLWRDGVGFELEIIGLAHAVTGAPALRRIAELRAAGRPVIHRGSVSDAALEQAYADCLFTVYPSRLEGFGLPVIESLARGRPCVCSGLNAMKESAAGGGCLTTGEPTPEAIAGAMRRLLEDRVLSDRLRAEAAVRPLRRWSDYARDILAALEGARRR